MSHKANEVRKSCPFCGADAVRFRLTWTRKGSYRGRCYCGVCYATGPTVLADSVDLAEVRASAAWDNRGTAGR